MNSKKATTADMDEDTILEIVVRLPLKYAIRCMVLNKNLFRLISQQKKALVSAAYPDIKGSIFCRCNDKIFKRITPGSSKLSITIPNAKKPNPKKPNPKNPIVLDSCNGVLLLNFLKQRQICVFNPITGGFMPLSTHIKFDLSEVHFALAVDLDAQTIFQFKLVVAETVPISEEESLWKFTVFVPSGGTSWLIKSPVEFISRGDPYNCIRSVYVNGCVYWADQLNSSIIMFNVEKEKATCIQCPEYFIGDHAFLFGSSDGSLLSVYNVDYDMEIYSYDQVKDEWQLKHKITHTHTISDPRVLFCNGQHLLIDDHPPAWKRRTCDEVLVMYDILSDKWDKFSQKDLSFDISDFFPFVPTLAKVSDMYLDDPKFKFAQVYLRGLQRLVMQETRDGE